jgi:hypothetical protein
VTKLFSGRALFQVLEDIFQDDMDLVYRILQLSLMFEELVDACVKALKPGAHDLSDDLSENIAEIFSDQCDECSRM